jgi:hypothetical protein
MKIHFCNIKKNKVNEEVLIYFKKTRLTTSIVKPPLNKDPNPPPNMVIKQNEVAHF